jgi:RHS repeat-associated protein
MTHGSPCSFSAASGCGNKFTGKERDTESGLDMFGARYYGSSLGRFMTPDWAAKATAVRTPVSVIHKPSICTAMSATIRCPRSIPMGTALLPQ